MKTVSILTGCLFLICGAITQAQAFEAITTGQGTPQYRFDAREFVYQPRDLNNIDITTMLERQGIPLRNMKLERLKLLVNGKITATFQTYGDNGIHTLGVLNATPNSKILFIQDTEATKNRRWRLLLSNPDNFTFQGMHVTFAPGSETGQRREHIDAPRRDAPVRETPAIGIPTPRFKIPGDWNSQ